MDGDVDSVQQDIVSPLKRWCFSLEKTVIVAPRWEHIVRYVWLLDIETRMIVRQCLERCGALDDLSAHATMWRSAGKIFFFLK